jgi:hypothetical protein
MTTRPGKITMLQQHDVAQRHQRNEDNNASAMPTKTLVQCWQLPPQMTLSADPVDDKGPGTTTTLQRLRCHMKMRKEEKIYLIIIKLHILLKMIHPCIQQPTRASITIFTPAARARSSSSNVYSDE